MGIKNTGSSLNLTLVSDAEVQACEQAEQDAADIKADLVEEHEEGLNVEQEPEPEPVPEPEPEPTPEPVVAVCEQHEPEVIQANVAANVPDDREVMSKKEYYNLPQYIRK